MKMNNYFKRYMISKGLLSRWWIVSIILSALLVTSCRTTKENTSLSLHDNLTWNRKVSVGLAIVPPSLAELTIPMDSLRRLPEGAIYTKKSGQATLTLKVKGDSIQGTASCDSLQQLVFELQEQLHQARDRLEQKEKTTEPITIPFLVKFKWCLIGILTGFILTVIIQRIKKWQERTAIL
ncbi:hypothetical protein NXY11_01905 [Parabacteroides faecis]|uniref:hypothetical protein n=1 Tax=Parabacteroides faecis TaxID=1217282 RepID=UPI0021640309|nr:hypothetical protein [Parabacteroides faecis]MCS2894380.1 hypothetical protein [Parabacteroides faecis]UVQ47032.1 hypothetical protein NXY11_01905 [Parabacteroides faecis]